MGYGGSTIWRLKIEDNLAAGATFEIEYAAAFSTRAEAEKCKYTLVHTYKLGNNMGFDLIETIDTSHFNDLQESTIANSQVITNGNISDTYVAPVNVTLNSGAKQKLYGGYIRTNLVEAELGADKKPVYTESAVTYVANYLRKTLNEPWDVSGNTYNLWYVLGRKLFDDNNNYVGAEGTRDLASVLRSTITGGMGTYSASWTVWNTVSTR